MLRWPGLAGGWSTQQQYLLEPVLAAGGAGRGGRGKEGCKLVPQAVVARWWQVEEQE